MKKHVVILFVFAIGALAPAASSYAQTPEPRPERPYRGLFGGGVGNAEQLLKLNASFAGGYDDDILAGETGSTGTPTSNAPAGRFARGSGALSYSLTRTKVSFATSGAVATSYIPDALVRFATSYDVSAGGSIEASRKTTVSGSYGMTRQPLYYFEPTFSQVFDLIFGEVVLYDQDNRTIEDRRVMTRGTTGVSHQLTRRLSASAHANFENTTTSSHSRDFDTRSIGGGLSYSVAKGLGVHAGYGLNTARYDQPIGDELEIQTHTIDVGVDYSKALSFSRKTTLSFGTGTSALNDGAQTHYIVTGNVNLKREMGRTWNAQVGYHRDVSYVDVVRSPLLSDSLTAGVGGLITRKAELSAGVGVSRGNAGFANGNNNYQTYFGSVSLRVGLTRDLAMSVQYARYKYSFDPGVALIPGVPARSDRQMLRVSIDFWEPIFYRARRGNASR